MHKFYPCAKVLFYEVSTPQTDYRLSNYHVNKNIFKCKEEFSLISKVIVQGIIVNF